MSDKYNTRVFGILIAFVVPGIIGLSAVAMHFPTLREWLGLMSGPPTIAGFLFVLVIASGTGVFLSGIRWLVLERWIWHETNPDRDDNMAHRLQVEEAYQDLVSQLYYYYLFYGNTLVALVLLFVSWAVIRGWSVDLVWVLAGLLAAEYALYRSARDAYNRFHRRRTALLGSIKENTSNDQRRRETAAVAANT